MPHIYEPFDEVFFRSPSLPIDNDYNFTDDEILQLIDNDEFRFALYIASPELLAEAERLRGGVISDAKSRERMLSTILNYRVRMSMRSTPFGFFAGSFVAKVKDTSQVVVDSSDKHRHFVRLDMNVLCALSHIVASDSEMRPYLSYQTNNSLYEIAGNYRYVEYTQNGFDRKYFLREVENDELLAAIVSKGRTWSSYQDLLSLVISAEVERNEAESYLNLLIENQILISSVAVAVTGEDFLAHLLKMIGAFPVAEKYHLPLRRVQALLATTKLTFETHYQIQNVLRALLPDVQSKNLVQADLYTATKQATLSRKVVSEIRDMLEEVLPLCEHTPLVRMRRFIERFNSRFEGRELPLEFVLDAEVGVGYDEDQNEDTDNPQILNDIPFPQKDFQHQMPLDDSTQFKLNQLLNGGGRTIHITTKEIETLKNENYLTELSESIYLHGTIISSSAEELDAGNFMFYLRTVHGPSAARLLGRFCFGDDEVRKAAIEYCAAEEALHPDLIYAEVAHLPHQRMGNVMARPHLRYYEIPYLSAPSLEEDRQILASDLLVSIVNNQIMLRSKRLNKYVIPRLTTAHHHAGENLPVYKFLGDLQNQGIINSMPWAWNFEQIDSIEHFPRVVAKKIILSRAQWNISLPSGLRRNPTPGAIEDLLDSFIVRHNLPNRLVLIEGDNEILVDMQNTITKGYLLRAIKKDGRLTFVEDIVGPNRCFIRDELGRKYSNEVIIPLRKRESSWHPQYSRSIGAYEDRILSVGTECLYVKIYCGSVTADKVMCHALFESLQGLVQDKTLKYWFFIRYGDPDQHLRVRCFGVGKFWIKVVETINTVLSQYVDVGLIHKIQIDSYQRELDRYSIMPIEFSERFFFHDSISVCKLLMSRGAAEDEDVKWIFALKTIDHYLSIFGFTLGRKKLLMDKLSDGFHKEFNSDRILKRHVDMSYRKHKSNVFNVFDSPSRHDLEEIEALIGENAAYVSELMLQFNFSPEQHNESELQALLASYIHMFVNRLFRSAQRKMEYVIYSFLSIYYTSKNVMNSKVDTTDLGSQ